MWNYKTFTVVFVISGEDTQLATQTISTIYFLFVSLQLMSSLEKVSPYPGNFFLMVGNFLL